MPDFRWAAEFFDRHAKNWEEIGSQLGDGNRSGVAGDVPSGAIWPPFPGQLQKAVSEVVRAQQKARDDMSSHAKVLSQMLRDTGGLYLDAENTNKDEAAKLKKEFDL